MSNNILLYIYIYIYICVCVCVCVCVCTYALLSNEICDTLRELNCCEHITSIVCLNPLLGCKIVHLLDRSDLFKISNLVYDGRKIVRSLYSSLQGKRVYGGYTELAGLLFVSVKIDGLWNVLEQLTLTAFGTS
jgi:hypothetical protein